MQTEHHQHPSRRPSSPRPTAEQDSGEDNNHSGDDKSDDELDDLHDDLARGSKRKRPVSVSCELCKQRKVKCDRGQPSCGWCSRNNAACEYKPRKKPGLRAGYGRELEQRLDKLEAVLRAHSEILKTSMDQGQPPSAVFAPTSTATAPPSARGSIPSLPSDHGTPRELLARTDPMRSSQADAALFLQKPAAYPNTTQGIDFGVAPPTAAVADGFQSLAAISPTRQAHPAAISSAAAQDFYRTNSAASAGPLSSPPMSIAHAQISSDQDLPPYDLLYSLVDLYFKHVNTWCPILHRKTTLDSLFGPSMIEETDKILLHAIVATTLRYSSDARLTDDRRQHYHDISKQHVLLYGMENSSVKALQALVILALDLYGNSNGPPGWNIMALITRSVVQLGLAVESNSLSVSPGYTSIYTLRAMILPEPKDFIEEESRRRLFWMIYLLDRYATIATAFEFALNDREIDRTLPCRDDLWVKNLKVETRWFSTEDHPDDGEGGHIVGTSENLGAFSYYIEILGILSKIHNFLKQPIDISRLSDVEQWQMRYKELDNMLTGWKFGLPPEYGNMAKLFQPSCSKSLSCGWVMLHATYHTAVIRLHSSAAYPTTRSPIFTSSFSASQRCHGAVENVEALGDFVVTSGMLPKLGPPFAFNALVSARLLLVHGSTVEHKLSPKIQFFVNTLGEMGRYWPVAAKYYELLQRVLDEHHYSHSDGVTPSSVKILADMRRTAFDLDFLISRQPRRHGAASTGNGMAGGGGLGPAQPTPNGSYTRYPSATPARTPQPNELEYLDVFDFFNVPRLPPGMPADLGIVNNGGGGGGGNGGGGGGALHSGSDGGSANSNSGSGVHPNGSVMDTSGPNEFNITDFMVDVNRDWLYKQEGGSKFLS